MRRLSLIIEEILTAVATVKLGMETELLNQLLEIAGTQRDRSLIMRWRCTLEKTVCISNRWIVTNFSRNLIEHYKA